MAYVQFQVHVVFFYVQFQVQAFFSARTLSVSGMAVLHFILKFLCFQNLKLSNCFTHSSTGICVCSRLWRTLLLKESPGGHQHQQLVGAVLTHLASMQVVLTQLLSRQLVQSPTIPSRQVQVLRVIICKCKHVLLVLLLTIMFMSQHLFQQ